MSPTTKPDMGHTAVVGVLDPGSAEARIGLAWRELRRGSAQQTMRERLYGDLLEPAQVDALDVVIGTGDQGCRMAELAAALRVDRSTATRTIDRLVGAGVVTRRSATGDGRGVQVVATDAGLALYDQLSQRRRAMLFSVLDGFDGDDRRALADLLERLVAGIDRYSDRRT
jgi:DNA-binding MarR family transcriptional regulator